jgi:hypothetical protein
MVNLNGALERVRLIRIGSKNSRVERTLNGVVEEMLVSDEAIAWGTAEGSKPSASPERIIPVTPLHRLYSTLRDHAGGREAQFVLLKDLLDRVGMPPGMFMSELFSRSVAQFSHYNNAKERFTPGNGKRKTSFDKSGFAIRLVDAFRANKVDFSLCPDVSVGFVDYEVNPNRTTLSCYEDASSGERSGGGGMDFLLVCHDERRTPAVAEVKARTETVGPTFALIQGLKYLSELASPSQQERIGRWYSNSFGPRSPESSSGRLDLYLIFEENKPGADGDFEYMRLVAQQILKSEKVTPVIRRIVCLRGHEDSEKIKFDCLLRIDAQGGAF